MVLIRVVSPVGVVGHKSGCVALNGFKALHVFLEVGVGDGGGVLEAGPDDGEVGPLSQLLWEGSQVSLVIICHTL